MTRVSTYGNFQSALLDLMAAQARGRDAQTRISTQKNATDLQGFGRGSETLTALKSAQGRVKGFIEVNESVAARLAGQDLFFTWVTDGATGAREAIAEALAAGQFDGLMQTLEGHFQSAREGLNGKHNGQYLFAGGNSTQAPVEAETLADLTAAASIEALFSNDTLKARSRVDENSSVETGFLADEVGTELFEILRDIQAFHEATPISGASGEATRTFLTAQLERLDTAHAAVTETQARNGGLQNRIDGLLEAHDNRSLALENLIGDRTDADVAKAITDLELSQVAIQASAQVITSLRDTSLLYLLR